MWAGTHDHLRTQASIEQLLIFMNILLTSVLSAFVSGFRSTLVIHQRGALVLSVRRPLPHPPDGAVHSNFSVRRIQISVPPVMRSRLPVWTRGSEDKRRPGDDMEEEQSLREADHFITGLCS
ncbi:hypothetical protein NQZ68_035716 [Dissostichus eleginoides]|nr:hypothetical protein NQZ68_035716 [Dissostichus eleginoides]